jgi:2-keto-4-pentenoate hydratase
MMAASMARRLKEPALNSAPAPVANATPIEIARRFVCARLDARALAEYPGPLPANLDDAYARQDAAIGLWPDRVVGWKVGKIPQGWADVVGEDRLVGPIFAERVQIALPDQCLALPVIDGGFAAVEAEYIFVLGHSAPQDKVDWTPEEAAGCVGELRIGIEFAGSPLATINHLGPAVVVSDFGNNAGLLLGPLVDNWRAQALESLCCETFVGGRLVGRGGAASISGGPLTALAFALNRCARRGRALVAGDIVSTGASTGIHDIRIGEQARVEFAGGMILHCVAERALPRGLLPRDGQPC